MLINKYNYYRGGDLLQEYIVLGYAKSENQRFTWLKHEANQKDILRAETYVNLRDMVREKQDAVSNGNPADNRVNVGKQIILPSTHVGGPRYMSEKAAVCY